MKPEEREAVAAATEKLKGVLSEYGTNGFIAYAVVGLEMALKQDGGAR